MLAGRLRPFSLFTASVLFTCTLLGCGGGSPAAPASNPQPAAKNLQGNWLIFGFLPSESILNRTQGLTLSMNVSGDTLQAVGELRAQCGTNSSVEASIGSNRGTYVSTTVAPDGTFTASTPTPAQTSIIPSLTISGKAPTSPGEPWSGTYSYTNAPDSVCPLTSSGTFTATPIADISGSYKGTAKAFTNVPGSNAVPVTVTATLQQGAVLQPAAENATPAEFALDGTLQIEGTSCFSKGTTSTRLDSIVMGSRVIAVFTMDDGSTLILAGDIVTPDAGTISVEGLAVTGGVCSGGVFTFGLPSLLLQK